MRYPLLASVLLAVSLAACDSRSEQPTPAIASPAGATASSTATRTPTPSTTTSTATPTFSPTPAPSSLPATVTWEDAEVWLGPGEQYGLRGRLHRDDEIEVVSSTDDGEWLGIDGVGWIRAERVEVAGLASALPAYGTAEQYYAFVGSSHPASTTTGDPAVDRVVGMVRSGDLAALAESLHVQTVQCPAPVGIGELPCPDGVPDGSLIEVIGTVDGCEGSYALAEDAAQVVEDWYSDAPWGQRVRVAEEPPDLYAAFRQGDSMAVVFAFESGVGAIAFVLPDGSVSLSPNVCEHWPANELVRNSDDLVRYLLPPVRPAPLTAYAPPLDPNVRTGDPQIDAIIDATMDGHVEDLASLMEFSPLPCSDVSREGFFGPGCPDGVPEGTKVDSVFRSACSGGNVSSSAVVRSLEFDFGNAQFETLAVFFAPREYEYFSEPGQRVVVFWNRVVGAFPGEIAFFLGEDGIVAWQALCDGTLIPSDPNVDYIVPPPN